MPNTYTQLHVHCIFAVKYRAAVLKDAFRTSLHKYIAGIVQANGHKLLAINSVTDHLHLFFGLNPAQSIAELMRQVKGDSSEWINKHHFTPCRFQWQDGYGAFSNSRSQMKEVVGYIMHQEEHHRKKTFREEYLRMLQDYEIEHDARYLFHDLLEETNMR
jgi:REP element-mobilizing transposase RayT